MPTLACMWPFLVEDIEILAVDGASPLDPGEEGEIVVTNLTNYAMPLIRYRIGDTGIGCSMSRAGGDGLGRCSPV